MHCPFDFRKSNKKRIHHLVIITITKRKKEREKERNKERKKKERKKERKKKE